MDEIKKPTPAYFKYLGMNANAASQEIQGKSKGLFQGVDNIRDVTWFRFAENFGWKVAFNHFLEYYSNSDYPTFLENEFKKFKDTQTNNSEKIDIEKVKGEMEKAQNEYLQALALFDAVRYDPKRKDGASIKPEEISFWLNEKEESKKDLEKATPETEDYRNKQKLIQNRSIIVQALHEGKILVPNALLEICNRKQEEFQNLSDRHAKMLLNKKK